MAPFHASAQPVTPPPISGQQLGKLLDAMARGGALRQIGPAITTILGIGHDGDEVTCVQISYGLDDKHVHTIGKLQDRLGYVLSYRDGASTRRIYYADDRLTFRRAAEVSGDDAPFAVSDDVARPAMAAELRFWAKLADADFK